MTTKEASVKFQISEKDIRSSIKDKMLHAMKESGRYIIDDNIAFIPIKRNIQAFLFKILQYKNNNHIALDFSLCHNEHELKIVMDYLFEKGYISQFNFTSNINELFSNTTLTDKGISFAIGKNIVSKRIIDIHVSFPINIGLVNI